MTLHAGRACDRRRHLRACRNAGSTFGWTIMPGGETETDRRVGDNDPETFTV